ncbi:MFS transporter [Clostridium estertheticum]|uniref:MFS transporter n=1 Tax=Clostridium estertheticum TaxID=238834 RepID=UPI001CF313CD|nr:MFS transporter [Clostridium estertheticum]MCB2305950.1 MFS transporter [Clostridium estertheticum]MCB2345581.1 MFS transporter [Clostridium estertheticum]MCB2349078.1 MFS transporter [Clostridium estertheticum]WAG47715.1 MFS transporter [Clostridium estertheticum]
MKKSKVILGFTALIIGCFLGVLDSTIVNIALPDMATYLGKSINDVSWVTTAYLLSFSVFLIIGSKIADQFGRKKILIIGLFIFGLSSLLCGVGNSFIFLIIMRFFQGIGAAIVTPVVLPLGLEIFGKEKRGFVIAVSGGITALAAAAGPPMGGIIIQYLNWKYIFYVNVPMTIIAIVFAALSLNESYDTTVSKKVDVLGAILLMISIFCLVFSLLKGNDYGWQSKTIVSLFCICFLSIITFLIIEVKTKEPMLPLNLFKESTFTASCILYMSAGFATASPLLLLNFYLEEVFNYSPLKSGLVLMTLSLASVLSIPLGSILVKKIGSRLVNFSGILIVGVGTVLLSQIDINTSITSMRITLVIMGIGFGFSVQSIASSIKYLPVEKSGIASGIINAARQIGTCIGIAVLVSILNSNFTNATNNIKKDVTTQINSQANLQPIIKEKKLSKINNSNQDSILGSNKDVIRDIKNKELSKAFDNTFVVSYTIVFLLSICALFTDRKPTDIEKLIA